MDLYQMHKLEPVFFVKELANVSHYDLPRDFVFEGESHDSWELTYVDRGQIAISVKGEKYLLKQGEMVFYTPGEFHSIHLVENKPASIIVVTFNCDSPGMDVFQEKILLLGAEEKRCLSTIVQEAEQTYTHFDNVPPFVNMEKSPNSPFGSEQIIKNALEQLFIYICRRGDNIGMDARMLTGSLGKTGPLAEQVKRYMHEHLAEKLTLEQISEKHNISVSQLKRSFKEQTGTSVISYLIDLRIRAAKRLIKEGELNFTQIAEAVGYDNIYYFSTMFKKQTGKTPTEYSKSVRR